MSMCVPKGQITANRKPHLVQGLVMPRYMPEPGKKILDDQPSDMASHRVP